MSALAAPREAIKEGMAARQGIRTAVTQPEHRKRMQRPAHCHRKTGGPWRQGGRKASCNHGRNKASAEDERPSHKPQQQTSCSLGPLNLRQPETMPTPAETWAELYSVA